MSDHAALSYNDGNGTAEQPRRPCQSAWMAHWTDTSCKTAGQPSLNREFKEDDYDTKHRSLFDGPEIETNISIFGKRPREVTEVRTAKIKDERLVTSLQNLKKEQYEYKPFPMFKVCENKENMLASKTNPSTIHGREIISFQIDPNSGYESPSIGKCTKPFLSKVERVPPEAETPPKNCNFQRPEKTVKFYNFFENNSLAASSSSNDDYLGSTSKTLLRGVSSRAPILSMQRGEEMNPSSSVLASKEQLVNCNCHSFSACLLHDPSASHNQLPVIFGKQCKNSLDHMGTGPLSCECCRQGCCSLPPRVPCSVSNVESMKELFGHPSKVRRTLITEETDVNLSAGGQLIRESRASAKFKGKMLSELLSLSQDTGFHGQQGVKLQLLGSSTDNEEKENSGHVKNSVIRLKTESSADTDTMEMNALHENRLSGMTSSPSIKEVDGSQVSPLSQVAAASAKEETGQRLPDINERLPELPAVASSIGDRDTSSSRTQSLDVERLFSNAEQAADSKSNDWPAGGLLGPDPGSRWIKRLKLSASGSFALGTKSSKMSEASSHEKANNKFFSKIIQGSPTSSEAMKSRCHGKDKIVLDQTAAFLRNAELSTEPGAKFLDKTLAHSWIRRWCHNQAMNTRKNPEAAVICEPESFTETSDKFQKKQFPSIAAMALMGKSMKGFRPCEFREMGSSVVWNTEQF